MTQILVSGTDSNVLIGGLSAVEVVLVEELGQLWLDAAQRLVLAMKQHHQVRHSESLTHQHQQLPKEPWTQDTKKNVHNQEGDNIHINESVSDIISKCGLLLTRWFLGTDENVG